MLEKPNYRDYVSEEDAQFLEKIKQLIEKREKRFNFIYGWIFFLFNPWTVFIICVITNLGNKGIVVICTFIFLIFYTFLSESKLKKPTKKQSLKRTQILIEKKKFENDQRIFKEQLLKIQSEKFNIEYDNNIESIEFVKSRYLFRKRISKENLQYFYNFKNLLTELNELIPDNTEFLNNYWSFVDHWNYMDSRQEAINSFEDFKENIVEENNVKDFVNKLKNSNMGATFNNRRNINTQKIGLLGELFCFEIEKEKLEKLNLISDKYPFHTAKILGDGFGYDILSKKEDLQELLIEVKTTINGIKTPFEFTRNEMKVFKENKNKYQIFRIYDFDLEEKTGDYYTIDNFEEFKNDCNSEPITYKVSW